MAGRKDKSVESQSSKREAKERQRQIEKANASMIPVPKATRESMGLISFDADGIFRLTDNRFVKMYVLDVGKKDVMNQETNKKNNEEESEENMRTEAEMMDKAKRKLLEILHEPVESKIRFTKQFSEDAYREGCDRDYITLTARAQTLDEAKDIFNRDEAAIMKYVSITPMNADDVLAQILRDEAADNSYASLVRAKKDWYKEMPCIQEEKEYFRFDDMYGEGMFVLQYPDIIYENPIGRLRELGCPMVVAMDIERITPEDQIDFIRSMEKRYNRRIPDEKDFDFLNTSMQLMYLCDSDDARRIIEKTILSLYSKEGFIMVPAVGSQKDVGMSLMSLGLIGHDSMRNVPEEVVRKILM